MHQHVLLDQPAATLDVGDEGVVGLLDVHALGDGHLVGEQTVGIHGARELVSLLDDPTGHADPEIVLSKGWCLVDDTRTGVVGDVGIAHDLEVGFRADEKVEQGLIPLALEVGTEHRLLDGVELVGHLGLPLFLVHSGVDLRQPGLGQDVPVVGFLVEDLHVFHFRVDAQRQVGGEGPRGSRPGNERNALHVLVADNGKGHHHGRIADVLVVRAGLRVGKDGRTTRRVGHDLESLVDHVFFPELRKDPPHGFHKGKIHRLVIVFEIDPSSQPGDGGFPFFGVPHDDAPAGLVVLVNSHFQNLVAEFDVEHFVDFLLDGQTVAIPSRSPADLLAVHGRVTGDGVLDGTREDVTVMRQSRGKGGTVEEDEFIIATLFA
mmetsp:Transcript_18800/g.42969  ORF Transcript_18800/g.42969 Transcript_18800/m.42969 type:complete len:376 (+) Transcript_18800:4408-5535(+)